MVETGVSLVRAVVKYALYAFIVLVTLWGGARAVDQAAEARFFKDFLVKWEQTIRTYSLAGGSWPALADGDQVKYMNQVLAGLRARGLQAPDSNTGRPYVYQLTRLGRDAERIFVLTLPDRIVLYGLSAETLDRLDKFIDGRADLATGAFTGYQAGKSEYVGVWRP